MWKLPQHVDEEVRGLLAAGVSLRKIVAITGVAKTTILRRKQESFGRIEPKRVASGPDRCDHCGNKIEGKREFDRRTRRTKHKFCGTGCFGDFYRAKRQNDKCSRCGRRRYERMCSTFTRGMCGRCYGIMRQYGFDPQLAAAHEITKSLKKELNSVRPSQDQKHRRPPANADRDDRAGA